MTRPDTLLVVPGIAVVIVLVYGSNPLAVRAAAHVGVTLVATTALGGTAGLLRIPTAQHVLHEDVFWSAPPDLMLPEPEVLILRSGCTRIVMGGVLKGLLLTGRFQAEYEPVRVRSEIFEPLVLYANSDWVSAAPSAVERLGWSYCDDPRAGGTELNTAGSRQPLAVS
jgi:hypothetical protein